MAGHPAHRDDVKPVEVAQCERGRTVHAANVDCITMHGLNHPAHRDDAKPVEVVELVPLERRAAGARRRGGR